jgi:hypothetical protein
VTNTTRVVYLVGKGDCARSKQYISPRYTSVEEASVTNEILLAPTNMHLLLWLLPALAALEATAVPTRTTQVDERSPAAFSWPESVTIGTKRGMSNGERIRR